MEALKELPPVHSLPEVVKDVPASGKPPAEYAENSTCLKTNGVADVTTLLVAAEAGYPVDATSVAVSEAETLQSVQSILPHMFEVSDGTGDTAAPLEPEAELLAAMETSAAVEHLLGVSKAADEPVREEVAASTPIISEQGALAETEHSASALEEASALEIIGNVTFTTEIIVEKNCVELVATSDTHGHSNNILNELGQGMELSEALRSSDNADNLENNNCSGGEEVFNKEELLDILEGNEPEASTQFKLDNEDKINAREIDKEIALNQLSRLKYSKKSAKKKSIMVPKKSPSTGRGRPRKILKNRESDNSIPTTEADNVSLESNEVKAEAVQEEKGVESNEVKAETVQEKMGDDDSIVNNLVKDWDDDDPSEMEGSHKAEDTSSDLTKLEDLMAPGENAAQDASKEAPIDSTAAEVKGSGDEAQPVGRHGRVIKKKVPFDPDNPPTFTKKVKRESKDKELKPTEKEPKPTEKEPKPTEKEPRPTEKEPKPTEKEPKPTEKEQIPAEKEQSPKKKFKSNQEQVPKKKTILDQVEVQRSKSKSPMAKMQWKKPTPKSLNSNKNGGKRCKLTEVDRLLMDEGAVNMIYQLTPEAPKGKKNMRTKAEFIKKVQRAEPDGTEMKFRERKKESKGEDGEPRKISGGKQRSSMSSAGKSPAVNDDFETHSADDSIIYRRHSSSSYSSTCMSPRRLSDVDLAAVQAAARASREASTSQNTSQETTDHATSTEVFKDDSANVDNSPEVIKKRDGLSIKDQLSKKISQALNKRKLREAQKTEKPLKKKKVTKVAEVVKVEKTDAFKYVSVTFDQRLAEICILKATPSEGILVFKELDEALKQVDSMKDISVTLLTSECGGLSSKIDLNPLLDTNMERRTNYAYEIAESIRRVLSSAATHSKLLVTGTWGACGGVALALLVLSDTALAVDTARFCAASAPPAPGLVAITSGPRSLPPALVNELIVFGRWLSTSEAAAAGLVTRVWPGDAAAIRQAAVNIAAQPPQSIHMKKQLLNLSKTSEAMARFQANLETERDMLVEYWTSIEGQDVIRNNINGE